MSRLDEHDRAILVGLIGEALADRDEAAVASAIEDLRGNLPQFHREAALLLTEEVVR